ncbi:MAG: 3-hydroxyacyl-CoA dehydrogenase NAD-binding domain-containing protein, partial [Verrucomicrobiales bacterium]
EKNAAAAAKIERTAVIGAGVMGAGIAHWLSSRKLPVILQDLSAERVAAGLSLISKRYAEAVKRRIFTRAEAARLFEHVSPAAEPVPLVLADLVIEAATEKLALKKKIFENLEKRVRPEAILATNTSALPIGEIAAGLEHPERVIGLHFFNPVHRMQLVEIVVPETTDPAVVESALAFVKAIAKLPVIVSDTPGFLVNRVLMPYLVEAGLLYQAGVSARAIDEAMLDFGMPMGPLRLLDEIGLDVALDVAQTLAAAFPERMMVPPILERLVAEGRLGHKGGGGFYQRGPGQQPARETPEREMHLGADELRERMTLLMVNEAARCLEQRVVATPEDADFAMIMGTGFAPFRGGPLRYADDLGIPVVVETLRRLAQQAQFGPPERFQPCARLLAMENEGEQFYPPKDPSPANNHPNPKDDEDD